MICPKCFGEKLFFNGEDFINCNYCKDGEVTENEYNNYNPLNDEDIKDIK